MNRILHLGLIAFVITSFGCSYSKIVNKQLDERYSGNYGPTLKLKADYMSIKSPLITTDVKPSVTTHKTKNLLPLIVYWQYDYVNTCSINNNIPLHIFSTAVQSYANSKGLKQKLNGQRIELSVDRIPNTFLVNDRAHIVWLIYGFHWDKITFRPDAKELMVSYKLLKDNVETKTGTITIANSKEIVPLRFLQSTPRATGAYIDVYDENLKAMSKKVVDQLLKEI